MDYYINSNSELSHGFYNLPIQLSFIFEPPHPQSEANWQLSQLETHTNTSKFDLTFELTEIGNKITSRVEYNTDLFDDCTITRIIQHYKMLVLHIIKNPEEDIRKIPMLSRQEENKLLTNFSHCINYPLPKNTIEKLFQEQAKKHPNKVALTFENKKLTYASLDYESDKLSHYILNQNIPLNSFIVVCMDRDFDFIISILGVIKAGCAYIPINPNYPEKRIKSIINECSASFAITQSKFANLFNSANLKKIFSIDKNKNILYKTKSPNNKKIPKNKLDNLIYVLYTSGSTGKSKGVMVTQQNVLNYITWFAKAFKFNSKCSIDFSSSISFDFSVTSTLLPLAYGAQINICTQSTKYKPNEYLTYIKNIKTNYIKCTPSYFRQLLSFSNEIKKLRTLRYIILGGEQLDYKSVKQWLEINPNHIIVNEYGPTETTVAVSAFTVNKKNIDFLKNLDSIPIGTPAINTNIYILDDHNGLCPIGIPGELCIAGKSVTKGYLNLPEQTKEKYITYKINDNELTLYKTGDFARWTDNGYLEFISRMDDMVKIRGYRIECGDVKSALLQHKKIKDCMVVPEENHKYLRAYVVTNNNSISSPEIRSFLKNIIPLYMIPADFKFADKLPLNVNDKIENKNLQQVPQNTAKKPKKHITNETEKKLVGIWEKHLRKKQIGIYDNFFTLGGHSLLALQILIDIKKQFNTTLQLSSFFLHPTITEMAKLLTN